MAKTLRYIGADERFFEIGVTGSQQMWLRGQVGEVSDVHAPLLLASGRFEVYERAPVFAQAGVAVDARGHGLLTHRVAQKVAVFGHSFYRNGWRHEAPWLSTLTGSINGVYVEGLEQLVQAGSYTLTIDKAAGTVQFAGGQPVPLRSGYVRVPGPTGLYDGVHLRINNSSSTNGSMTITRNGSRGDEIFGADSALVWAGIFSRQSIDFVNYSASGLLMQYMAGPNGSVALDLAAMPVGVSALFFGAGTNDTQAGRSLAQMQADAIDIIDRLTATGLPVFVTTDPPVRSEWNSDAIKRATQAAYSAWLASYCSTLPNVKFVPMWDSLIPETGSTIRTGYASADGTHPGACSGQLAGHALWRAMGSPIDGGPSFGSADSAVSDASPYVGNFLSTPYLLGTNARSGTGFSGNFSNNTTVAVADASVVGAKVTRADGVAGEWEQCTFASTVAGGNFTVTESVSNFVSGKFPQPYSRAQLFVEVECEGAQMCPDVRIAITSTYNRFARSSAPQQSSVPLPIQNWSGVLATAPLLILPVDSNWALYRHGYGTASTVDAVVRFGRRLLRQVA